MYRMFNVAGSFNQELNSWNVSSVTTMHQMFFSCKAFNQELNSWNVSEPRVSLHSW
jgi:surface protein